MTTATLTSKGQITIPASVRGALRLRSGDRVEFVEVGPGSFEIVAATGSVRDLKGALGPVERHVSIDEMNEAIASGGASAA